MSTLGYWVIRTYLAGMIGEKIKYWVPGEKPSRSERRLKADIRQQQRNEASAEKRMARLVHANFTEGGKFITLTYDDGHMVKITASIAADSKDYENELYHVAHHQLQLWLRRVRTECAKQGVEFRYIAVTSDVSSKTGEVVRPHHHIILNEEAAEIALSKWKNGKTNWKWLDSDLDKTELVEYILRQVRRLPDKKKYIPSRNLIVPQPKDRVAVNGAELAVPKNGQLLKRAEFSPGMPQYIRYILPEVGQIKKEIKKREQKTPASAAQGGVCARTRGRRKARE